MAGRGDRGAEGSTVRGGFGGGFKTGATDRATGGSGFAGATVGRLLLVARRALAPSSLWFGAPSDPRLVRAPSERRCEGVDVGRSRSRRDVPSFTPSVTALIESRTIRAGIRPTRARCGRRSRARRWATGRLGPRIGAVRARRLGPRDGRTRSRDRSAHTQRNRERSDPTDEPASSHHVLLLDCRHIQVFSNAPTVFRDST